MADTAPLRGTVPGGARNGAPVGQPYGYRGTGRSLEGAEVSTALATSREARAAVPAPGPPPAVLKGAVKVRGFPARGLYPFAEIAADGGVWRLDPSAFSWRGKPTQPQSVRAAASKYATEHGLKVKTVVDGGHVYVQFKGGE